MGRQPHRALGNGTSGGTTTIPARVPGLSGIVAIAAGDSFSLALRNDGTCCPGATTPPGSSGTAPPRSATRRSPSPT
ncbi:hypothetical protein ACLESO_19300 [Pyxidicoccus sp. 3LG]